VIRWEISGAALVLRRGGEQRKLAELDRFEPSDRFSDREKAALAYAEAMTDSARRPAAQDGALGVEPQGFCAVAPQPQPKPAGSGSGG
jgi:alkylhydroperoxidase family enzyme